MIQALLENPLYQTLDLFVGSADLSLRVILSLDLVASSLNHLDFSARALTLTANLVLALCD